ncbi:hypothetical protein [Deinococcus radiophilus]|uniref:hypothetical protein n=1 Tax=Deinococcus radiophilus TaxID=32062 RepID=UPI001E421A20|nr:hypothetical protein [Deinococcus radiophilus]UFA50720.1 hypothetical protein LMT64_02100 [Deinococcus radiophilus]
MRRRTEAEMAERLHGFGGYRVYVVGHMHCADTRQVGDTLLVSAGPATWTHDPDPRTSWLLLERRSGVWYAERRRVEYDREAAARWIRENRAPDQGEIDLILKPVNDPLHPAPTPAP